MSVRYGSVFDLVGVFRVLRSGFPLRPELWFLWLHLLYGRALVATNNKRVVGVVCYGLWKWNRNKIGYLAVLPQYQRRGIGTELMREAEQVLAALGHTTARLKCEPGLARYYAKQGYEVQGKIVMQKPL